MRENIGLYRGKRKDNGEWVEGAYYKQTLYYGDPCEKHYIITSTESLDYDQAFEYYEVDPETVGQYIGGIPDKNGTKIFEGDILNTSNSNCRIWYVDYKNTAFCANQGNANYSCVLDEFMQYSSVEVIGNRFDNPELLQNT